MNGVRRTQGGFTGGEYDFATGVLYLQGGSGGARISLERFFLHLLVCTGWCTLCQLAEKLGWLSFPIASGGFLLLLGDSSFCEPGLLVIEVPDPLLSGDDWLVRSMFTTHV